MAIQREKNSVLLILMESRRRTHEITNLYLDMLHDVIRYAIGLR